MLEYRGSRVLEAEDGVMCLRFAREQGPDVIVLDLYMSGLDGWQVAEALRADPATRGIPILAFTASAMADDHRLALEAGCRCVMVKPAAPSSVADEIAALHAEHLALLDRSAAAREDSHALRQRAGQLSGQVEDLRATLALGCRQSAEQVARSEAAGAAASGLLGGGPTEPPAAGE